MAETKTAASALRRDMDKAKDALVTKVKEVQHNRRSESGNAEAPAGACALGLATHAAALTPPASAESGEGGVAAAERFGAGVSPTGARLWALRPPAPFPVESSADCFGVAARARIALPRAYRS